jgi:hypothetical protein
MIRGQFHGPRSHGTDGMGKIVAPNAARVRAELFGQRADMGRRRPNVELRRIRQELVLIPQRRHGNRARRTNGRERPFDHLPTPPSTVPMLLSAP